MLKTAARQVVDSTRMTGAAALEDTYKLTRHAIHKLLRLVGKRLGQQQTWATRLKRDDYELVTIPLCWFATSHSGVIINPGQQVHLAATSGQRRVRQRQRVLRLSTPAEILAREHNAALQPCTRSLCPWGIPPEVVINWSPLGLIVHISGHTPKHLPK